ncbi:MULTISPECIES: RidA family protein [unclassified Acidovorax]|uniref:RidA family protein n=1 Tax=unclassified Acidovorax TaxID=2684926 RepID=UPI001C441853|nr:MULTISPECIES: RidA family protein [unclassified Acidovorax]MBV7429177.1 RidA family protein [Acidovorax sp. sif0732]MBV7451003.1 RidA family protein [Acidovorax sp. sif0715]
MTAGHAARALCVGVWHARTTLSIRVACMASDSPPGGRQDDHVQFMQVLAAAERLLREAGADPRSILSCDVFVRGPAARTAVLAVLRPRAARWPTLPRITPHPSPCTPQATVSLALVAARPTPL